MENRANDTKQKRLGRLDKAPTGIAGFDDLSGGGLPAGRPTLICGGAGCGKTLFAVTFLYKGASEYGEPGVFVSFEEGPDDLIKNVASLKFRIDELIDGKKFAIDHVRIDRTEPEETGEYDLEGLFVRLNYLIDSIGAKRVVLDSIETLFGGLANTGILRSELQRLFRWTKDKSLTLIVTGEGGNGQLTRQGLEEYLSDCVIFLDNRVHNQISTRRLRIIKYRGSTHGTNEYPFLIDDQGISVMPITSVELGYVVSTERISSGIPDLDLMMGGEGYFRGSSVLISGTSGTGKTSTAATFANSACSRGERCLYFAMEESPLQVMRNMRSLGLDLGKWVDKGLLRFSANRSAVYGLEMHLAIIHREIDMFAPLAMVVDPLSSFAGAATVDQLRAMSLRLIHYLKSKNITLVLTDLTHGQVEVANTEAQISSLMDSWLLLHNKEYNGERNRQLYLLKSRGMAHSNQVREFLMTNDGIVLRDVYLGPEGVLTGSARLAQEAAQSEAAQQWEVEVKRRSRASERKQRQIHAQIDALKAKLAQEEDELKNLDNESQMQLQRLQEDRRLMAITRNVPRPVEPGREKMVSSGRASSRVTREKKA